MNKKGFTLVEILAVIVILGLVMVVVGTKGFGAFDTTKNKIAELNEDAIKEAANVLMMDVENCDDDLDEDLTNKFGKSCSELKSEAKNGLDIPLSTLKDLDYISGSDIENIKDDDVSIKAKIDANNKIIVKITGNIGGSTSSSDTNGKIVYVSNEGDDYNDGTESKPYKTIEQIIKDYPSSDLTINMLTDITINDIVESDGDITINGNENTLDVNININMLLTDEMILNDVKVKCNYSSGGAISNVVSLNNSSIIYDFEYTNHEQSIILNKGTYKLEVWGAQGGYRTDSEKGGKGGYSTGEITLNDNNNYMYIYVGGQGGNGSAGCDSTICPGGFNGGGYRYKYFGGGGATDIRLNDDSLYARVIVAGGGGSDGSSSKTGMYGGGENGGVAIESFGKFGYGGTQTGHSTSVQIPETQYTINSDTNFSGGFGFGGFGVSKSSGYGGAGGGGWYGGCGSVPDYSADDDRGGGGGSGYVYTETTASSYPSGCLLNSDYYLSDAETIAGNQEFTSPTGGTEIGHSGNGYARITQIGL